MLDEFRKGGGMGVECPPPLPSGPCPGPVQACGSTSMRTQYSIVVGRTRTTLPSMEPSAFLLFPSPPVPSPALPSPVSRAGTVRRPRDRCCRAGLLLLVPLLLLVLLLLLPVLWGSIEVMHGKQKQIRTASKQVGSRPIVLEAHRRGPRRRQNTRTGSSFANTPSALRPGNRPYS